MSEFIATAQVVIRADTTLFSTDLKKALTAAEKKKIFVKIVPDPKGFSRAANEALRNIKIAPVKVLVTPDLTGFRSAVRLAALEAVKGLAIPVGVTAGQVAAPTKGAVTVSGVGKGGVVDKRVAAATLAVAAASEAGVSARRKFNKELSASEKQFLRDVRIATQLKTATDAVTASIKAGIPVLHAEAEALLRTAVAADIANTARRERAAAAAIAADPNVAAAAANAAAKKQLANDVEAAKRHSAAIKENQKRDQEAGKRQSAAIAANEKRDASAAREFVKNQGLRIAAIEAEIAALTSRAQLSASFATRSRDILGQPIVSQPIGDQATLRNQAFDASAQSAARSEAALTKARFATAVADVQADNIEKRLTATRTAENAATIALVESQDALDAARIAGLGPLIATREEEARLAAQRLRDATTATAAVEGIAARAGRVSAGQRALQGVGATLLGLRGAALSAEGAFIAVAAGAIALTKAVQSAADLESTLNVFRVTAGATGNEMSRVSRLAIELGRDISLPGVTATDAAEGLEQLSKAGLSVKDSMDGVRGVLQLATAAQIDNAQATEFVASALNAFGLAGNQAVRVADVFANAAKNSQGSIEDISIAMQQANAVARQAGLTLEQTAAVLTLFARNGLKGSDAGTSFRTALIRLINPTAKAQREIDKLGLSVRTSTGAINLDVFDEFAEKTRNLTAAQRDQALAIIFGQDAIRGAAILAREGSTGLNTQITAMKEQGTAADLAAARMAGLTGSLENLKNQLTSTGLIIGASLIPSLKVMADSSAEGLKTINNLAEAFGGLALEIVNAGKEAANFVLPEKVSIPVVGDVETGGIQNRIEEEVKGGILLPGVREAKAVNFLVEQVKEMRRLEGSASDVKLEVNQILSAFQKTGNEIKDRVTFTTVIAELTTLQDKLAGGDKEARRLSGEISDIIAALQKGNAQPTPFRFPKIELPADLKSGAPGKEAGEKILSAFDAALPQGEVFNITFNAFEGVGRAIREQALAAANTINAVIPTMMAQVRAAIANGVKLINADAVKNIGQLEEKAIDIELAGGSPDQQIANLRQQFKEQQRIVDTNTDKLGEEATKARRDAKDRQAAINREIEGIEEQRKTDAKQAADDIRTARDEADQAFLDSLEPGRAQAERRVARAQATTSTRDDISALQALRQRIQTEINAVRNSVKDAKTKTKELAGLAQELFENGLDLAAAREARDEAIKQSAADRRTALRGLAEATNNVPLLIQLLNQEIAEARDALIKARAAKEGITAARAAVQTLIEQKRKMVNDAKTSLLDDAFQLAELKGNKSAMLQILDLQIAQARLEVRQAKTLAEKIKEEIDVQNLIKKRQEILTGSAEDAAQSGTTAFALLQQNVESFNANAGNLINGNQPFAGATGFTSDIAQFLVRKNRAAAGAGGGSSFFARDAEGSLFGQPKGGANKQDDLTTQLIAALKALTDATLGKTGNRSTVPPGMTQAAVDAVGQRGEAMSKYYDSKTARKVREGRSGI